MAPPAAPRHWSEAVNWIWVPHYDDIERVGGIVLFRKTFHLVDIPSSCIVNVSADSRYRLFVNGTSVSFGPAKSHLGEWNYESIDIASFLKAGQNIICARVLRYSPRHSGNLSLIRATIPGFILHTSDLTENISSDTTWRCSNDDSVVIRSADAWDRRMGPSLLLANEEVDGSKEKRNWTTVDFNDSTWPNAIVSSMKKPMLPILEPHKLVKRTIPALTEEQKRFSRAVKVDAGPEVSKWNDLLLTDKPLSISAHAKATVVVESNVLTTGFLQLHLKGGSGSRIEILYAECFEHPLAQGTPNPMARNKASRSDTTGILIGLEDLYTVGKDLSSQDKVYYEPFWLRTFRYIQLTINTSDVPLEVLGFTFRESHYPLSIKSSFSKIPDEAADMWRVSLNTLRNCMHETYEDCPFYEQNQFAMDARLQILFTYQVSGDDRLARKCMQEFYSSRRSDGLIETHFPVPFNSINIPFFSLYWIFMIHDHLMYFGDSKLVKRYIGTIDGILDHFANRVSEMNGLVGRFDWDTWPFVDWTREWSDGAGDFRNMAVPPAYKRTGFSAYSSLIYAYALNTAADLCDSIGRRDTGVEYRSRATSLNQAVRKTCLRDGGYFVDGPDSPDHERSQHAQVFAVLSGAVTGEEARAVMKNALVDKSYVQCSYAMSFYLFQATKAVGLYKEMRESILDPWRGMLKQDLTTWAESAAMPRSDCHGWSSYPIHDFVANVAGISPAKPGFETVRFEPGSGIWKELDGEFVVGSRGMIRVAWDKDEASLESDFDTTIEVVTGGETKTYEAKKGTPLKISLSI